MKKCEICGKDISSYITPCKLNLYGSSDFYELDVCEKCYNYGSDCFTPEEVDNIMGVKEEN